MKTVNFIEIGEHKKSWTTETENASYKFLKKELKKKGGLSGTIINFQSQNYNQHLIYSGTRQLGKIVVVDYRD